MRKLRTATREPPKGRLNWLQPIAAQVAEEAGIPYGEHIENITIMAFEGLLNDPATAGSVSYHALLDRTRHNAAIWARENGSNRT